MDAWRPTTFCSVGHFARVTGSSRSATPGVGRSVGPSRGGRLIVLIGDVRVGAQSQSALGQDEVTLLCRAAQSGVPGRVASNVAAASSVHVEAHRDEQFHRVGRSLGRVAEDTEETWSFPAATACTDARRSRASGATRP